MPARFEGTWVRVDLFEDDSSEQLKHVVFSQMAFRFTGKEFTTFSPKLNDDDKIFAEYGSTVDGETGPKISLFTLDEEAKIWYGCQAVWEDDDRVDLSCEKSYSWGGRYYRVPEKDLLTNE